jgi:hypothetical protein
MSKITNPASPGAPTQLPAESPIRAPLAGGIAWAIHAAHPAVVGPTDSPGFPPRDMHVRPVPAAVVDAAGGKMNRPK